MTKLTWQGAETRVYIVHQLAHTCTTHTDKGRYYLMGSLTAVRIQCKPMSSHHTRGGAYSSVYGWLSVERCIWRESGTERMRESVKRTQRNEGEGGRGMGGRGRERRTRGGGGDRKWSF